MNKVNTLCAAVLLFLSFNASAQVKFKLAYDQETERYTVSVIPLKTYLSPGNMTGDAQITIKVATNSFDPVDIQGMIDGTLWEANSRVNAPMEAPDYDYISFALTSLNPVKPEYKEGEELALFSFKNAFGCNIGAGHPTAISFMEPTDEFFPPNSVNANVGNSITIVGAGGDAYEGIEGTPTCDCNPDAVLSSKEQLGVAGITIFPNPATDFINVKIDWTNDASDASILIMDATGKQVIAMPTSLVNGKNNQKIQVSDLPAGSYWVYLAGEDFKIGLDRFSKQ